MGNAKILRKIFNVSQNYTRLSCAIHVIFQFMWKVVLSIKLYHVISLTQ